MTYEPTSPFLRTLKERGYIHQCTDLAGLDELASKENITAYVGFDPTADSLHVGNLVSLMMLRILHRLGGTPVALIGAGTALIGDPSDKTSARPMLTDDQIKHNSFGFFHAFDSVLGPPGEISTYKTKIITNDWLLNLNFIDFMREIGPHFTVNRMLTMDFVKNRLEKQLPLSLLEFNYMIMQAYDFVELHRRTGCVLQMGGSDQWGNIVNGIELGHRLGTAQLYGLTTNLITTASGAKMGKTVSGAVWLHPNKTLPYEYFQFWRNTEDGDVERFLKLFTDLPLSLISEYTAYTSINRQKEILAFNATEILHGKKAAFEALEASRAAFGGKQTVITALPSVPIREDLTVLQAVLELGFAESKSAVRRLIDQKGVYINGVAVVGEDSPLAVGDVVRVGKKRHGFIAGQNAS